jgi:prepilin-type N-terminal cleavage/methylation domain-containing protein
VKRRGFTLIEVVLAVALTAGPIVLVVSCVQNNISRAHKAQDLALSRLALGNLMDILSSTSLEDLREMCSESGKAQLETLLAEALPGWGPDKSPASARSTKKDSLVATLTDSIPDHKGLVKVALAIQTPGGAEVSLQRFMRPLTRDQIGKLFGKTAPRGAHPPGASGSTVASNGPEANQSADADDGDPTNDAE